MKDYKSDFEFMNRMDWMQTVINLIFRGGLALLFLMAGLSCAQAESARLKPLGLERGQAQEVLFQEEGASGAEELWTSFGAEVTRVHKSDDTSHPNEARFQLRIPERAVLGVGAMRLVGSNFLSVSHWVFIDDLPVRADLPAMHSASNAPIVTLPLAIEGHVAAGLPDVYRFEGRKDQVVTIDALGRRLDSRLSPVIQILTSAEEDIAYSNHDPSLGGDARLSIRLTRDDTYSIRIADLYNKGGADRGYYIRIGDFPMIDSAHPLVVARGGSATAVAFDGQLRRSFPLQVSGVPSAASLTNVPVKDKGPGFTFARMMVSDLPEFVEVEDNQPAARANPIKWPTGITGRFDRRGDVDWFQFHVEKGESLTFRAFSKTLGSPADVLLRLHKMDGTKLIELNVNSDPDPFMNHTFAEAGDYLLRTWESTGLAGTNFNYHLTLTPHVPDFKLQTMEDRLISVSNSTVKLKITADRKGGYTGPIRIAAEPGSPVKLTNEVIEGDKKETDLTLTLADPAKLGKLILIRLTGSVADPKAAPFETMVSTRGTLMFKRMGPYLAPREFDGQIALLFPPATP